MNGARCLVVEDEALLGELLVDNLRRAGFAPELVTDGDEALAVLGARSFDLVVLDLMLPRVDGFAILRTLRARDAATPVLILSARGAERDRVHGLELRADDYLVKPFSLPELLLRCQALLRRGGRRSETPPVVFGGNHVDVRGRRATTWRGEEVALTPAELALVRMLAARPGEVVERAEIVAEVFGPGTSAKHRTVDNLVLRLRRLFEKDPKRPRHFHTIRAIGLRFDADG